MTLNRRQLLGAGAAVAAAGIAGEAEGARRPRRSRSRRADVVVIGAGLAGLTAARRVAQAGRSVIVLEARGRVGGRVENHDLGGGVISEAGGTFAGPTQNHVIGLAKELGVGMFETFTEGDNVYVTEGERMTYRDTGPTGTAPPDPLILADLASVVTQLNDMSTTVPVDAPWAAARASEWDGQTLETWIRDNSLNPRFRALVPVATRPIFGAEPRDLSLLFVLFYIAASGDERHPGTFERNFNTRDGAQMFRFAGGSGELPHRMAQQLGRRVVLGVPARRISQGRREVRVDCGRLVVTARYAVVALPPTLANRIVFEPALETDRDRLGQRLAQGNLGKVACVYDRPFWREQGLNGSVLSTTGPITVTIDDSPPEGRPGIVFGFVGGDDLRAHLSRTPQQRRQTVLEQMVRFFGAQAAEPREYFETIWPQMRWSRGGPVGVAGPGTLVDCGAALRRPFGRLHWAGSETSTYWNGYMDGAVRSGERAAREVLDRL